MSATKLRANMLETKRQRRQGAPVSNVFPEDRTKSSFRRAFASVAPYLSFFIFTGNLREQAHKSMVTLCERPTNHTRDIKLGCLNAPILHFSTLGMAGHNTNSFPNLIRFFSCLSLFFYFFFLSPFSLYCFLPLITIGLLSRRCNF